MEPKISCCSQECVNVYSSAVSLYRVLPCLSWPSYRHGGLVTRHPPRVRKIGDRSSVSPSDSCQQLQLVLWDLLAGQVINASPSRATDPGFDSRLHRGDFSGTNHTSDLKIESPVATLPGAWRHRVCAGTGWPGVSTLWLGGVENLIWNFYLSVTARELVWADLSLRYTSMLLGR